MCRQNVVIIVFLGGHQLLSFTQARTKSPSEGSRALGCVPYVNAAIQVLSVTSRLVFPSDLQTVMTDKI